MLPRLGSVQRKWRGLLAMTREKKEYFDPPEELDRKIHQLAEWIMESKHFIVFTVSL